MGLCDLNPEEILFLEIAFSIVLIDGRSAEELNLIGSVLTTIGSVLMAQAAALDCPQNSPKEPKRDIVHSENLLKAVAALELRLEEIEKKLG